MSLLTNAVFLGGGGEGTLTMLENKLVQGQTTIYVCVDKTCKILITNADHALQQMK
jgi:hypothetical protein